MRLLARPWYHPLVFALILTTGVAALLTLILGFWGLANAAVVANAQVGQRDWQAFLYPTFDWVKVVAGAVWIAAFVGGIMGCLLHLSTWWTTGTQVTTKIEQTRTLTAEETLKLEEWLEAKQCEWGQLRRLWS